MIRLPLIVKAAWSSRSLEKLYNLRRALKPSEENRTKFNICLAGTLFFLMLTFLMAMSWQRQSTSHYLESRSQIIDLPATSWRYQEVPFDSCLGGGCFKQTAGITLTSLGGLERQDLSKAIALQGSIEIPKALPDASAYTITLPQLTYNKAVLQIGSHEKISFFNSEKIKFSFDQAPPTLWHVYLEPLPEQSRFYDPPPRADRIATSVNVMPSGEWQRYQSFVAKNRAGRGNSVGAIARIVMAVFVLLLFLIIDGSPETLGLGLFMGFEAFAISAGYGWLPIENTEFIRHYAFQMGDIFRLYFFLQLARVIDRKVLSWFLVASALSVPYGLLRHYGPELGLTWPQQIPPIRDILIGSIGTFVCLRSMYFLKGRKLPWRTSALLLAAIGSFEQTIDPLARFVPLLNDLGGFTTVIDLLQPASTYLIAFSAFINISTMENRVKELSAHEAQNQVIKEEMQLGRTVQQAFLRIPHLPNQVKVAVSHEAMHYVSGDTFYIRYHEMHEKITFLVNDLTGHGIQAALKASAVSVLAQHIWQDEGPWRGQRLAEYEKKMQAFLDPLAEVPDRVAMSGGEFCLRSGHIEIYRANFPFPILIEPNYDLLNEQAPFLGELWKPSLVVMGDKSTESLELKPGSFLILTSDGFIETSRRQKHFLTYLRRFLANKDERLTPEALKQAFLNCDVFDENKDFDDRTLMVFQWDAQELRKYVTLVG